MRKLLNRQIGPTVDADGCAFRYVHSETGHKSCAWDFIDWEKKIFDHRVGNGLSIPDNMMELAEDQLCGTLPPEQCVFETGDAQPVSIRMGYDDVARGMRAYGKLMVEGARFVDQAEADRRAAICVSCPLNVNVEGCASCRKVAGLLTGSVAKRRTKQDSRLRSCAVCKCVLQAKIWFPLDILNSVTPAEQRDAYPSHCWLKSTVSCE